MEPRVNQDEIFGVSGGRMIAVALVDCKDVVRLIVSAGHTKILVEGRFDRSVRFRTGDRSREAVE